MDKQSDEDLSDNLTERNGMFSLEMNLGHY